jgi:hypothetical protein
MNIRPIEKARDLTALCRLQRSKGRHDLASATELRICEIQLDYKGTGTYIQIGKFLKQLQSEMDETLRKAQ